MSRALRDLKPERARRLNGLVNIGIGETSYRKGDKYITIVVNHDINTVVWVADGHGKSVLEQFYKSLTDNQLASIKVVTGDGARWITDCVNEFTPDCERCVDPFHVVEFKLIICKAYGFRNIQNMMDMMYLVCSYIRIPLPNRKSNVPNVA